jgi:hypothetical protein
MAWDRVKIDLEAERKARFALWRKMFGSPFRLLLEGYARDKKEDKEKEKDGLA